MHSPAHRLCHLDQHTARPTSGQRPPVTEVWGHQGGGSGRRRVQRQGLVARGCHAMDLGGLVVPGPVIELLYVEHCPCVSAAQSLVQRTCAELGMDAEIRTVLIPDQAAADRARFLGSPTVRVAGRDVEPGVERSAEYTVECRLYRHEHRLAGYPQERWVRDALMAAVGRT